MYTPRVFAVENRELLWDVVDAAPFATLIGAGVGAGTGAGVDAAPEIAHVPVLLDRARGVLRAHVARANRMARLAETGAELTAVFHGPHGYVTPRWYVAPREQVPTWNYAVVHVRGPARALDRDGAARLLADLAARFEQGAAEPWRLADADPELTQSLLGAIVAFEIEAVSVEGKLKLSQNRAADDRAGVVRGLGERGAPDDLAMLALMRRLGLAVTSG